MYWSEDGVLSLKGSGQDFKVTDYRPLKKRAYFFESECSAFSEYYFDVCQISCSVSFETITSTNIKASTEIKSYVATV